MVEKFINSYFWDNLLAVSFGHLIPSLAGGGQPLRTGCPFELLRLPLVVRCDEVVDRRLVILDGIADAALEQSAMRI